MNGDVVDAVSLREGLIGGAVVAATGKAVAGQGSV